MSRQFGEALARLMVQRHLGPTHLAARTIYSAGYISHLKNGHKHPSAECAAELDEILGAGGALIATAENRREVPRREVIAKAAATAAAVPLRLHPADDISPLASFERVRTALGESDNLFGPVTLMSVVRDHIGLIKRMRHGKSGADARDLLAMQARFAEQLAWMLQDSASYREAAHWLDKALQWALMANDTDWAAYVLARQSQLAGDTHDPASAVDLAAAADRMASRPTRLRAAGAAYSAHGHALAGDRNAALRDLDEADEIAASPDDDETGPWRVWLDSGYVGMQRARSLDVLGDHALAADLFGRAVASISPALRRDRGVYLARQALAHAGAGDMDAATETGLRAAAICQAAHSGRIVTELRRLGAAARAARAADTADLQEAIIIVTRQQPAAQS